MADDIAAVINCNTKLQELDLHDNNLKTVGIIKIAEALQNISTLMVLNINDNDVNEGAAGDISAVLFYNTQLQQVPYTTDKSVTDLSQSYYEQICCMSVTDLYLKLPQSCCTCVTYS